MGNHFTNYLKYIEQQSPGITPSIRNTIDELIPANIKTFSFRDHITGLLLGNVQSGKTSQIFGIISAAADEGFPFFIFLTTDNVYLYEQTFKRALSSLETFKICGEDDDLSFLVSKMRKKPMLILLKKNTRVLQRWKNNLASSKLCEGHPLFIIDDEGDAASLNTKVNKQEQSTINKHLDEMKSLANSSIYLQVTATPQSLFLQSIQSNWKPSFVCYFKPGKSYLGGDFFYCDPPSKCIKVTQENELDDLRDRDKPITDGLRLSLQAFLIAGAHSILSEKTTVCNFLVHPSVRILDHESVATKLGEYLNDMLIAISEDESGLILKDSWDDLKSTKTDLLPFEDIHIFIKQYLNEEKIQLSVMNSTGNLPQEYLHGMNIIVGGNSLGRGVTFPFLQTVYYCRTAKSPQADTFWQHCRMFGYDRDPDLMRIFLPPSLLKLFIELNNSNRALLAQVSKGNPDDIILLYDPKIKPTRPNVIDKNILNVIAGGVNFFPSFPKRKHEKQIDNMLENYSSEGIHEITLNGLIDLLEHFESEHKNDWSSAVYINAIKALKSNHSENKAYLIVRRDRNIRKGTGTLLSPDDRKLGDSVKKYPVLTLYRVTGDIEKGWDGKPLWIPNIKLPEGKSFWKVDS